VQSLTKKDTFSEYSALAIDDGVIMQQRSDLPAFVSITEVVAVCISLIESYIKSIAEDYDDIALTLIGWSYGGVIASEVVGMWDDMIVASNARCTGLVAFDAPIRRPRHPHTLPESVDKFVAQHFQYCTSLLTAHYDRMECEQISAVWPTACPVFDYRPASYEDDDTISIAADRQRNVTRRCCAGDHWTMLIGGNATTLSSQLATDILSTNEDRI
jgi:pimeloyl-ACP methyl ester carboxylesterase